MGGIAVEAESLQSPVNQHAASYYEMVYVSVVHAVSIVTVLKSFLSSKDSILILCLHNKYKNFSLPKKKQKKPMLKWNHLPSLKPLPEPYSTSLSLMLLPITPPPLNLLRVAHRPDNLDLNLLPAPLGKSAPVKTTH